MEAKRYTFHAIREMNTTQKDSEFIVEGYATTFDREGYEVFDWIPEVDFTKFVESFEKGCFSKSITARAGKDKKNSISMLLQHQHTNILGVPELREDDYGLYFKCSIARGKTLNDDTIIDIENGNLKQVSIGFNFGEYILDIKEGEMPKLRHTDVYLWELSLVTFSANENAMLKRNRSNMNIYNMIKNYGEEQVREVLTAMTNNVSNPDYKETAMTNNVFKFAELRKKQFNL